MEHSPEILSLLSKLGHVAPGTNTFVCGEDVIKTLKNIRRLLNASETDHETRTLLEVHAITHQFVPLLAETQEEDDDDEGEDSDFPLIVLEVSKLLVLLTLPDSPMAAEHCRELRHALSTSKNNNSALFVLVNQIRSALQLDASKRTPEQKLPMDLLFWLVRNLLIGVTTTMDRDTEALALGAFFHTLESEFVMDICIHFSRHVQRNNNREWDVLFLEIFYYFFSTVPRSPFEKHNEATTHNTKALVETLRRQTKAQRGAIGTRHSNFNSALYQTENREFVGKQAIAAAQAPRQLEHLARKRLVNDTSSILYLPKPPTNSSSSAFAGRKFVVRVANDLLQDDSEGDSAYSSLFSSLIQCIQKEDTRFQPKDEIHLLWLLKYFPVHETTSTLWMFLFVVNKMYDYLEAKAWVSLELAVTVLFHMLRGIETDKAKLNLVFYELRQRLEIVPKLMRMFDPSVFSIELLRTLTMLGNFTLLTLEDMALEGAVSKAKQRRAKAEQARGNNATNDITWNAEEMRALNEGVDVFKGDYSLQVMRSILKHPTLGLVFESNKTAPLLLSKWMHIRHQRQLGKTLEQIVSEALEEQDENEANGNNDEEEEDPFRDTTGGNEVKEKKIDFVSELRTYLSNFVFHALSQLVDPALHESASAFLNDNDLHEVVALFFRRLRGFTKGLRNGETLEPILWHVANFSCWRRTLQVFANARVKNALTVVLDSSLRRFFRLASSNRMMFVEVLFWRTKAENLTLSTAAGFNKLPQLQQRNAKTDVMEEEEEEFRERLQQSGGEEEEDRNKEEEWDGEAATSVQTTETRAIQRMVQDSDAEEEEAEFKQPPQLSRSNNNKKPKRVELPPTPSSNNKNNKKKTRPGFKEFQFDQTKLAKAIKLRHVEPMTMLALELDMLAEEDYGKEEDEDGALVLSIDTRGKPDLCCILLALGMRPPNRSLLTKEKDSLACEAYWRCSTPASRNYKQLAEAIRACLEALETTQDDSDDDDDDEDMDEYAWCLSDVEEVEEEEVEESSEDEESAAPPTSAKRRRIIDSDDED